MFRKELLAPRLRADRDPVKNSAIIVCSLNSLTLFPQFSDILMMRTGALQQRRALAAESRETASETVPMPDDIMDSVKELLSVIDRDPFLLTTLQKHVKEAQ